MHSGAATLTQLELRDQLLTLGETARTIKKAKHKKDNRGQPKQSRQGVHSTAAGAFMAEIDVRRHCFSTKCLGC